MIFSLSTENIMKKKTHFRMHERELYYYGLEDEDFVFFNKVTGNKESYIKQQIKAAEK